MASLIDILVRMRGARAVQVEAEKTAASIKGVGTAAQTASAETTAATSKMSRSGQASLYRVGRQAKLLALGIGVLGGYAYKSAAEFQQSLNIFQAVSGATATEMDNASKKAIQLGADVRLPGVTAKSSADTMLLLSKAGFGAAQAIDATRGALLLSQAANLDANESTTILARTLKAFQMPASQAGKVVDALAAGELKSTVTMREIADGMTYASASAHQMGLGVTDTTTALAMLNDAGVAGTKAGTSLNQMFVRMSSPTKRAKDALQALRLWTKRGTAAFFDQRGEFVGFRRAAQLLTSSMTGLTRVQRLHYLYAIFGREGQRAADRVLLRGTGYWDNYRKAIGKTGQAQKLVNARMKGSKSAIEAVRNSWQTFMIALGGALAPILDPILRFLAKFINLLTRYPKPVAALTIAVFGLAVAFAVLVGVMKIKNTLKALDESFQLLAKSTRLWAAATWALDAAFSPWLLIPALIILIGAALYLAYTRVSWFRNAVNAAWDWIKNHWMLLGAILIGPFALAAYAIFHFRDQIKGAFFDAVNFVKRQFNSLVAFFRNLPGRMAGFLTGGAVGKALSLAHRLHLPGLALGGVIRQPGMAVVGERGPELVNLPLAARVEPLAMAGGGGGIASATIPVQVVLDRRVIGEGVARWYADKQARA